MEGCSAVCSLPSQPPGAAGEGLTTPLLVRAVRTVLQPVAVLAGGDAGAIRAAEPIALLL